MTLLSLPVRWGSLRQASHRLPRLPGRMGLIFPPRSALHPPLASFPLLPRFSRPPQEPLSMTPPNKLLSPKALTHIWFSGTPLS